MAYDARFSTSVDLAQELREKVYIERSRRHFLFTEVSTIYPINLFNLVIMKHVPFLFFINGVNVCCEGMGSFHIDDDYELDIHMKERSVWNRVLLS